MAWGVLNRSATQAAVQSTTEYILILAAEAPAFDDIDDFVLGMNRGGVDYLHHRNHQRSAVVLTNAGGQAVEHVRYNGFGSPTLLDANGLPIQGQGTGNPYLFGGNVCRGAAVGNPGNAYTYAGGNPWSGGRGAGGKTAGIIIQFGQTSMDELGI